MSASGIAAFEPIRWHAGFETGRPEIDIQHRFLLDLINRLGELLTCSQLVSEELESVFSQLWSYAEYHFSAEESLMSHHRIDPHHQRQHQAAHDRFFDELRSRHEELADDQRHAAQSLFGFLTQWLKTHMLGEDQRLFSLIRAVEEDKTPVQAFQPG